MTCKGCVGKVHGAVKQVKGVDSVQVDLDKGRCEVRCDSGACPPEDCIEAIAKAGFEAELETSPAPTTTE